MWVAGVTMMVLLCFGGLVGGGFFMHKHGVRKDAQVQTTKDSQKPVHEHGDVADGMLEDENNGTHHPMMRTEGSNDGKGIAKKSEIEDKK